ncbi:hypothetical protein PRIPAC_79375 [Pristionchus pacificus]|uniref:Uncharacterized protein n=1 Tax=Pristionchus pacificus TaxID=54126 RepID=A0A8R1Z602_PRIPA|nr:hypothetical protein PRIPAC_79375 [Pristionchus pacificus]
MNLLAFFLIYSTLVSVQSWVIYRKAQKQRLVCREEKEWTNSTTPPDEIINVRSKRDVMIDPQFKEPIIFIGEGKSNTSWYVDDGDFDMVSDELSNEEIASVKKKVIGMCVNLLSPNRSKKRRAKD